MANQKENFKRKTHYDKGGYKSSKPKKNENDYYRDYYHNSDYHQHQPYFTNEPYYQPNHNNQVYYKNVRIVYINDLLYNQFIFFMDLSLLDYNSKDNETNYNS